MSSNLLSILQKNYLRIMLQALDAYKVEDPKTWKGGHDWRKMTSRGASAPLPREPCAARAPPRARTPLHPPTRNPPRRRRAELFKYMWFDNDTCEIVGHAMALQDNDAYLDKPALPTMNAFRLYGESLARYGAFLRGGAAFFLRCTRSRARSAPPPPSLRPSPRTVCCVRGQAPRPSSTPSTAWAACRRASRGCARSTAAPSC